MSREATHEKSYRTDIDGLRAIAILSVVAFHAGLHCVSGGFTGVDVFFVISGYLIGGHILAELHKGTFSFANFYQRRAKRILPAYFAVLSFTVIAALCLLSPYEAMLFGRSSFAATLSVSNILFWKTTGYFDLHSDFNPLLMTWSLGVEEQFYAVVPILLLAVYRIRRQWLLPVLLLTCAASFGFATWELRPHPTMVFYMLPARAWEMGAGVLLAVVEKGRRLETAPWATPLISWSAVVLLLAPIALMNSNTPFPGIAALPSVLGATLFLMTPQSWVNRRIFSAKPLVFVGKVSYSFYLWHWPLLALARVVFGRSLPMAMALLLIAIAFAASVLSYYWVEQPFRKSSIPARPLLLRYAFATMAMLAICTAVWQSGGLPQRDRQLAQMESAGLSLQQDACLAPYGKDRPNTTRTCINTAANATAALWGDSHAAALAPGLQAIAQQQGYGIDRLNKASCLPLLGATRSLPAHPGLAAECLRFNQNAFEFLQSEPRIRIVILAGYWSAPLADNADEGPFGNSAGEANQARNIAAAQLILQQSLVHTVQQLQAMGKTVILMDDVPSFATDPLWRVRTAHSASRQELTRWIGLKGSDDPGRATLEDHDAAERASALLRLVRSQCPGLQLVDLKPELCDQTGKCLYRQGDQLLYTDNQHLSLNGAIYALRDFRLPATTVAARASTSGATPFS